MPINYGLLLLRIFCTFCVIVIHVTAPLVMKFGKIPNYDWHVANTLDSMSRFAVPVFFMISGALLLGRDISVIDFLKTRLGKLLPPIVFWLLFYSLSSRYYYAGETFNIFKIVKDVFYGCKYHFWFVYVLIGVYLITPVLQKWVNHSKKTEVLYFLIIWFITLLLTIPGVAIYFPKINFAYFSGYIGYFVLGYYLKTYVKNNNIISYTLIVVGLAITILGTYIMTKKDGVFYYYFYEYLCINALMVSIGVFLLFNTIKTINEKMKPIVTNLSNCSFGIYLIHPFILDKFKEMGVYNYSINAIVDMLLISIACFLVCFALIFMIRKIKFGNLIA